MRTNIDLDDALLKEARRHARARTKKGIVEEALRVFIATRAAQEQATSYRDKVRDLERRLSSVRLRRTPSEILREDRDRI